MKTNEHDKSKIQSRVHEGSPVGWVPAVCGCRICGKGGFGAGVKESWMMKSVMMRKINWQMWNEKNVKETDENEADAMKPKSIPKTGWSIKWKCSDGLVCNMRQCVDVSRQKAMLMRLTTKSIPLFTGPVTTVSHTALRHVLHFYFYEQLRVARSSSRRNLEPKRVYNLRLRFFSSSTHLL